MTVIEERNVVNDLVAVIEAPAEDITLNLDSEELHYLCKETNRPTLGANWDYLGWVYRSLYSYSSTSLGKLATLKVCRFMSVVTPLVDCPLKNRYLTT